MALLTASLNTHSCLTGLCMLSESLEESAHEDEGTCRDTQDWWQNKKKVFILPSFFKYNQLG